MPDLDLSRLRRRNIRNRQVPMRQQNLEAPLLFFLVSGLIGIKLFDEALFIRIGSRCQRRVLEDNRDPVVPALVLGHVVGGRFNLDRDYPARGNDLLKQRVMVLEEEVQKLLLMSPLDLVVILNGIRSIGRALRWRALGKEWNCRDDEREKEQQTFHRQILDQANQQHEKNLRSV